MPWNPFEKRKWRCSLGDARVGLWVEGRRTCVARTAHLINPPPSPWGQPVVPWCRKSAVFAAVPAASAGTTQDTIVLFR